MPTLTIDLTEAQLARYAAAVAKLHKIAVPTEGDLLEPLRATIEQFVKEAEVLRGDTPAAGWVFWTADLTPEQFIAACDAAIERRLNDFARERRYMSADRLRDYSNSTNPQWKADADFFQERCDRTWEAALTLMNEVQAGLRPMPASVEEVLAQLPPLAWPA